MVLYMCVIFGTTEFRYSDFHNVCVMVIDTAIYVILMLYTLSIIIIIVDVAVYIYLCRLAWVDQKRRQVQ